MFTHLYIYRIKCLLKNKSLLLWSLFFPIILGTLFYAGFGNGTDLKEDFNSIPVAVVDESTNDQFSSIINSVKSGKEPLFLVTSTDFDTANKMLENEEVYGVILVSDQSVQPTQKLIITSGDIRLLVKKTGINQSIIKSFLDQYQQNVAIISEISTTNPESLTVAMNSLLNGKSLLKEVNLAGSSVNALLQYFYSLIAMTCMMGCYYGLQNAVDTQANLTAIGARRSITPTHKMFLILTDTLASLTLHFLWICIVTCYLRFVLHVPIGEQPALYLLSCFIGSLIGVSLGQFIGAAVKGTEQLKNVILTATTLILSFLSGLMIGDMKNIIEHSVPILNRINPTSLITDAFYSLTVYNDYHRFTTNLITLTIMAVILSILSFLVVRREKYASI